MKTIVTHNGSFHADDVFATALLQLILNEELRVVRTRDEESIKKADYVIDVGGVYDPSSNRFDHHQLNTPDPRDNGIPYASFGLVWKKFGTAFCDGDSRVSDMIEGSLVQYIDAIDSGVDVTMCEPRIPLVSLHSLINLFSSTWSDHSDNSKEFRNAVSFATVILRLQKKHSSSYLQAMDIAQKTYENTDDKRVLWFDQDIPIRSLAPQFKEALFVVYPKSNKESWKLEAIKKSSATFELRKPLPESWRGLRGKDLDEATGVNGCEFCHKGGFLIVAKSKDAIKKLLDMLLDNIYIGIS